MTRRFRVVGALLIGLALAIFAFAVGRPVKVLPRMAPAPPYDLVDPWGRTVVAPAEGSPITLYTFGALRDTEGLASIRHFIAEASQALNDAGRGDQVRFVFVTIDPDHDTPDALRQALTDAAWSQDSEVTMLTGSWVAIRLVVGTGFGVYYEAPQPAGDGAHEPAGPPRYDPTVIIVDGDHVIRARYALEGFDTSTLVRDVNLLAKEAEAQGATRWIYEGAHLFLCYPR